jgi:hypothetical protein
MSVKIDMGPYRIESYTDGWIVGERRTRTTNGAEVDYPHHPAYLSTLTGVLKHLQGRWVKDSDARCFDDIKRELREFREACDALFYIPPKVIHREPRRTA